MTDQNTSASTPSTRHKQPHLTVINGRVKTTSLDVAEKFGKQHYHVLRDIKTLECPGDFTASNFGFSEYADSTGRKLPICEMTRDGFTILAMGFTGRKAMEWKIKYLTAFNLMEQHILEQRRKADAIPDGFKICHECSNLKPLSAFKSDRRRVDDHHPVCNHCMDDHVERINLEQRLQHSRQAHPGPGTSALMAQAAQTIEYQHELIKTIKGLFETIEQYDYPNIYRNAPGLARRLKMVVSG